MQVIWTTEGLADVTRLYRFLSDKNPRAAAEAVQLLDNAANRLPETPRIGMQIKKFLPQEIRRIFVGDYELRYALENNLVIVLRVWHTREDR